MKGLSVHTFSATRKKLIKLDSLLGNFGDVILAFSGGRDSTFLLQRLKRRTGAEKDKSRIVAIFVNTILQSVKDLTLARKITAEVGAEFRIVDLDISGNNKIMRNGPERCYFCKKAMYETLLKEAKLIEGAVVVDGTNADDLKENRPGLLALKELGIESPLAETGLTSEEIIMLLSESGLSSSPDESTTCLATRIKHGIPLNAGLLGKVERMDDFLTELGFHEVRSRIHGDLIRIELRSDQIEKASSPETRRAIIEYIKRSGFRYVCLDLEGYRPGTMNPSDGD